MQVLAPLALRIPPARRSIVETGSIDASSPPKKQKPHD
jgi:hypothetical protein